MSTLNKILMGVLGLSSVLLCVLLYVYLGPALTEHQISVLEILLIIAGASALYCFIIDEITKNNSQMDKLWSLLPETYCWIIAGLGGMSLRLIVMASLATLWGIRLTFNFARKGAYRWKFWEGREDYRWSVLRQDKSFEPHWKWVLFDLLFISVYQNLLVLLITFPALAAMESTVSFNWIDYLASGLFLFFLVYETIADEQQWHFQEEKKALLQEGKDLEDLPLPYRRGFNTTGLWAYSRHPNYFAEQSIWVSFAVFSIASGLFVINWSLIGALLLIVLFLGSSVFAEGISQRKYPEYARYRKEVSKFFLWKKYRG
jgi:steroid 5-alpha reductase family enzyme